MKLLVLNLGSTSYKFKLFEMEQEEALLATGGVENIGRAGSYTISAGERKEAGSCACATHAAAFSLCVEKIRAMGVLTDMAVLDAVGYKAVHGGPISGSRFVDEALLAQMEKMSVLAPAHNPIYVNMMRDIQRQYPALCQIACFETAFHATMPPERQVYGVPYAWAEEEGLKRYGFHGSSHSYIAWKMQRELPGARRIISAHLGGSSSMCAILDGKSVYNTMGATPQSGLFHNDRVGDMDVFCLPALVEKLGGMDAAMAALSRESGLLGLSGVSNDLREVEHAAEEGNARAKLALDALADEVAGYTGMLTAYLGGLDAIVFTGGIGFRGAKFRAHIAERLGFCGAKLDRGLNQSGYEGRISTADSGVELWSLETNEELMVARGCMQLLKKR